MDYSEDRSLHTIPHLFLKRQKIELKKEMRKLCKISTLEPKKRMCQSESKFKTYPTAHTQNNIGDQVKTTFISVLEKQNSNLTKNVNFD